MKRWDVVKFSLPRIDNGAANKTGKLSPFFNKSAVLQHLVFSFNININNNHNIIISEFLNILGAGRRA